MAFAIRWTDERRETLKAMLAGGATRKACAEAFKVSPGAIEKQQSLMGILDRKKVAPAAPSTPARAVDALPAGHSVSWGAITAGTVLDGARWPEGRA